MGLLGVTQGVQWRIKWKIEWKLGLQAGPHVFRVGPAFLLSLRVEVLGPGVVRLGIKGLGDV